MEEDRVKQCDGKKEESERKKVEVLRDADSSLINSIIYILNFTVETSARKYTQLNSKKTNQTI